MERVLMSTVCKQGCFKKVKPKLQMKYFVLHKDGKDQLARLEYYDTVKKWESKKKAKRVIYLRTCFSINSFSNEKVDHGLALYTKDDCFEGSFTDAEDRDSWLMTVKALINTHRDARPMFEHVWNVKIRERDLGKTYEGEYRLCLNNRTVIFVKKTAVDPSLVFPLEVIRRCGHSDNFFNLEVGRQAATGPGEFWMEVDDRLIAENVHHAIIAVMNIPKEDDFRPDVPSQPYNKSSTFGSGSRSGESSRRGERSRNKGKLSQSTLSNGDRGRTGSIGSRSTTSTALVASNASLSSVDAIRALENVYNSSPNSALDTTSTSLTDSRSSTPNRSLTPDPRPISYRTSDAMLGAEPSYLPMDMTPSPFGSFSMQDKRSGSISSASVCSWTSGKGTLLNSAEPSAYADMTCNSIPSSASAIRGYNGRHFPSADDGPYADMAPTPQSALNSSQLMEDNSYLPMTSSEALAPGITLSGHRRPSKTQSFIGGHERSSPRREMTPSPTPNSSDYHEMTPAPNDKNSVYLDMAPASTANDSSAYLDMAPTSAVNDSSAYLDMAPTSAVIDSSAYLDMAPSSAKDSAYLDMTSSAANHSASSNSESAYLDMAPASNAHDTEYLDMAPTGAKVEVDSPYLEMAPKGASTTEISSILPSGYMDMKPSSNGSRTTSLQPSPGALLNSKNPYIDMSGKDAQGIGSPPSSVKDDQVKRMDSVRSYLSSNENIREDIPQRHYSMGSRPQSLQKPPNPDQYVEMCRSTDLAGKSLSVPHLMPLSLASNPDLTHLQDEYPPNYPTKSGALMKMNYDRPLISSESFKQRPRGATWSANIRPRSASHGHKHKPSAKSTSSRESVQSTCSEYLDMQGGGRRSDVGGTYVEMGPSNHHQRVGSIGSIGSSSGRQRKNSYSGLDSSQSTKLAAKLSPPKNVRSSNSSPAARNGGSLDTQSENLPAEGSGFLPDDILRNPQMAHIGRRFSQPYKPVYPFPELSASSEEELRTRSAASSFSSTRSSSSSRSSLARVDSKASHMYGGGAQMDPESYVDCQQVQMRGGPSNNTSHLLSHTKLNKPTRVASFISEEPSTPPTVPRSSVISMESWERRGSGSGVQPDTYIPMTPTPTGSAKQSTRQNTLRSGSSDKSAQQTAHSVGQAALPSTPSTPLPDKSKPTENKHQQYSAKLQPAVKQQQPAVKQQQPTGKQQQSTSSLKTQSKSGKSILQQVQNKIAKVQQQVQQQAKSKPSADEKFATDLYVDMVPSQPPQPPLPLPAQSAQPSKPPQTTPHHTQHAEPEAYTVMAPLSQVEEDPYHIAEAMNDLPMMSGLNILNSLPVTGSALTTKSEMDSSCSTVTSSDISQLTTGTGSSGDSGQTRFMNDPQFHDNKSPSALIFDNRNSTVFKMKTPKSVPCYIRQNSRDINIYPSPAIPAACYIRSESNISTQSEFCGRMSPTSFVHDDILSGLAGAESTATQLRVSDSNEEGNTVLFNMASAALPPLRRGLHDPISPIRLPTTPTEDSLARSSESSCTDIPGSAAELQWQISKKLEQVQEERDHGTGGGASRGKEGGASGTGGASRGKEGGASGTGGGASRGKEGGASGTGGASRGKEGGASGKEGGTNIGKEGVSGKEGGTNIGKEGGARIKEGVSNGMETKVKSFIIDDTLTLTNRTSHGRNTVQPPPLPTRMISIEEKSSRHSSTADPSTPSDLIYVDITHDDKSSSTGSTATNFLPTGMASASTTAATNPSPSPKSASADPLMVKRSPSTDYTTIDHDKTMELSKKNNNVH